MSNENKQMKLGAILMETGHHVAAWRHPNAGASRVVDVKYYQEMARTAERGKLDLVFLPIRLVFLTTTPSSITM